MRITGLFKSILYITIIYVYASVVGGRLPYFILYVSIGAVFLSFCWSRLLSQLMVSAFLNTTRSEVGKKVIVKLLIENKSMFTIPWVRCKMNLPYAFGDQKEIALTLSIKPHEQKEINIPLECCVRGFFQWGKINLMSGDVFGLLISSKSFNSRLNLLIRPAVGYLGKEFFHYVNSMYGQSGVYSKHGREASEFKGVRFYTNGDAVSKIHWKASAKAHKFLVKEFNNSLSNDILLFLDLASPVHTGKDHENTIECSVALAASLASTAVRERFNVGLGIYSDDLTMIPPGGNQEHLCMMLDFLARAQNSDNNEGFNDTLLRESFSQPRGSNFTIITPELGDKLLKNLIVLLAKGYKVIVILIRVESFADVEIDVKVRDNNITQLKHANIPVVIVEKNADFRRLFGGIRHEAS